MYLLLALLTKQTSTSLSLTVTLSEVEGCLYITCNENQAKLNDIETAFFSFGRILSTK